VFHKKLKTENCSSGRVCAFQQCGSSNVVAANRIHNQIA